MPKLKNSNRGRSNTRANLANVARGYSNRDSSFTDYGVGDANTSAADEGPKKPRTLKDFMAERKKNK